MHFAEIQLESFREAVVIFAGLCRDICVAPENTALTCRYLWA